MKYRIFLLLLFCLFLFSCSDNKSKVLKMEDIFKLESAIELKDIDEIPVFTFTEFGFFAMQTHSSRVSKFLNDGTEEKMFGKKGKGPGEFEWGRFLSYSEDSHLLGIYDIPNFRTMYFNESCEFQNHDSRPLSGIPYFKLRKNNIEVFSYSQFPDNNGFWKNNIAVNDSIILSNNEKTDSQIPEKYYQYSYNSGRIIILKPDGSDFELYNYDIKSRKLSRIETGSNKHYMINLTNIINVLAIGKYIILEASNTEGRLEYIFLKQNGKYIGTMEYEEDYKAIYGVYNNHIYVVEADDSEEWIKVHNYILK